MCHESRQLFDGHSVQGYSARVFVWETVQEWCVLFVYVTGAWSDPFHNSVYRVVLWYAAKYVYSFSSSYCYYNNNTIIIIIIIIIYCN